MMRAPATRLWIGGIGALLVCAGCGFKGPLYLPEHNATVITHPAQGAQARPSPGQTQTPATKGKDKTSQPSSPAATSPPQSSPHSRE
jgi:predicted small lipoprotein YifL